MMQIYKQRIIIIVSKILVMIRLAHARLRRKHKHLHQKGGFIFPVLNVRVISNTN